MRTAGIICEYNPFHAGHRLQLQETRRLLEEDCAVVCLMSGNYVQRGEPAIWPKHLRAEAAVRNGADLVLELPTTAAVNAAGYFASGGIRYLSLLGIIDVVSFGSECGEIPPLLQIAELLNSTQMENAIHQELASGCSFAAARSRALSRSGADGSLIEAPNNALAVEYLRELLRTGSGIQPITVRRNPEIPSASSLRTQTETAEYFRFVPEHELYRNVPTHTFSAGERAMLAVLRTLPDTAFQEMPFGSEGLWSLVMKESRRQPGISQILEACKSKRYAYTRLRRMLLCLFLGLSQQNLQMKAPYLRVLAFNERGRELLHTAGKHSEIPLVSGAIPRDPVSQAYFSLESRAADLYDLFSTGDFRTHPNQERAAHPVYVR